MRALVYHGPGKLSLDEKPKPVIQDPTDAIVRIKKTSICGTDLDIVKGEVPVAVDGQTLGHEGVGVIEQVGENISNFREGDHVLVSCITSCGQCENCKKGMYSYCENGGGWILGNLIDGTQAEYVRIPFADTSLYAIPEGVDEESLVMLSDILPTGFECGVLNGQVKPGDTVAIIGAGPVGLAALLAAQFYSPSQIIVVDNDDSRLATAKNFGATQILHNDLGNAAEKIMALTSNRGVDVAMEAIGIPASFDICQSIVAVGGHLAVIGIHSQPVQLNLERLWAHNITITTRLVDTISTPMLMKTVLSGRLEPKQLITHRFTLDEAMKAYDTFENAIEERALKVLITND